MTNPHPLHLALSLVYELYDELQLPVPHVLQIEQGLLVWMPLQNMPVTIYLNYLPGSLT